MKKRVFVFSIVLLVLLFVVPSVLSQTCEPETCQSLGKFCGVWENGCGGLLDCARSCSVGSECNLETGNCELSSQSISIPLQTTKREYFDYEFIHLGTESLVRTTNNTARVGTVKLKLQKKEIVNHCLGADIDRNGVVSLEDIETFLTTFTTDCNSIRPLDVLRIINYLNSQTDLSCSNESNACEFRDINTDGFVTPIDALLLINKINECNTSVLDFSGDPSDFNNDSVVNYEDQFSFLDALETFPMGSICGENVEAWIDDITFYDNTTTISPLSDFLLYPFWNAIDFTREVGEYRAFASFSSSIEARENSYEFSVVDNTTLPTVSIVFPENTLYGENVSRLDYLYANNDDNILESCWYSISGGQSNSSFVSVGTNFTGVISLEGENTWDLYCNGSFGEVHDSVTFTKDTLSPIVSITFPQQNATYNVSVSDLAYTYSDSSIQFCWHSRNNGVTNSSLVVGGANFTNVTSVIGSNTWHVYCNDSFGRLGGDSVTFSLV